MYDGDSCVIVGDRRSRPSVNGSVDDESFYLKQRTAISSDGLASNYLCRSWTPRPPPYKNCDETINIDSGFEDSYR